MCSQVSPNSLKESQSRVWLKKLIYDLSAHSFELDATSLLHSNSFADGREERTVNLGPTDSAYALLLTSQADLAAAEQWWHEYQKELVSGPRTTTGTFDRIEAVPLYVQKSF